MIRKVAFMILLVLLLNQVVTAGENLTFSGVAPTIIPSTFGQYYENISEGDHRWVSIGNVVPRPFVDYFGENSELGWQVFFFIILGALFVILFGRQANVAIPVIVFMISGIFILQLIPPGMGRNVFTVFAFAVCGLILYLGRRKR